MQNKIKIGIILAFSAAIISGLANFVNKWGVTYVKDPFVYTTMKNVVTAFLLIGLFLLAKNWRNLKLITKKDWVKLVLIGLVGGSVPFLLFFWGLKLTSPASASFVHKTMFIWVALLAWPFLKEKFRLYQYGALAFLFLGNFALAGLGSWQWGKGETLVLIATLLWAVEFIISKKVLKNVSANIVAGARMVFGSILLLAFLTLTGRISLFFSYDWSVWKWAILTGAILFLFVISWYHALSRLPATLVTSILVVASPITTLLEGVFVKHEYSFLQGVGSLILLGGAILFSIIILKYGKGATENSANAEVAK